MPQSTSKAWIQELVAAAPQLKPLYDEHLADYDEILPHVFLGGLTTYVSQGFTSEEARNPKGSRRSDSIRILNLMEEAAARHDPEILNLISVSFLENVDWEEGEGRRIRAALGPELREEQLRREKWRPGDP